MTKRILVVAGAGTTAQIRRQLRAIAEAERVVELHIRRKQWLRRLAALEVQS